MPTGYTAKLVEKGQTFKEFALTCARAFGACIELRDEPLDAPLPQKFEPSPWHKEQLETEKSEVARLKKFSESQKEQYGTRRKAESLKSHREYIRKQNEENARVEDMIAQVTQWEPPTEDHVEMKKFMLEQLNMSLGSSEWSRKELENLENLLPVEIFQEALIVAEGSVEYHKKSFQKDVERTKDREKWIQQLRESLKGTK